MEQRTAAKELPTDRQRGTMIDWSQCPDVESVPGRCSGAWVVKATRVMVQGIIDNAADASAEEIATQIFELPVDVVRRILAFAAKQ